MGNIPAEIRIAGPSYLLKNRPDISLKDIAVDYDDKTFRDRDEVQKPKDDTDDSDYDGGSGDYDYEDFKDYF
ncbi:hypothetical protein DLAC_01647 [Tieghemostelium lacteum]|uniref:Uncharacterized protein n=1 Tax=Tieghemostelium lacteum TaxID=361077 RepID=A0A152A5Y4_TIELA|nr:hypothetical protein DLAC_01647 [Tieghemostelium lacteum]|eukprot:KYR01644.1 hypothetical protein DLAC_01647 [Tieghemostelium lacteum]